MRNKPYKIPENTPQTANEPAAAYRQNVVETSLSGNWNPNVPFHGTQEEWWEHFHRIEGEPFYPVSEAHQRISKWLENQKK